MSHTPGPWTVDDVDADDIQSPHRDGKVVVYAAADCDIHPVADAICNHTCRDIAEQEANARLIASAPDLLAALEQLLEGGSIWEKDEHIARDALAKAKGTA